MKHGIDISRYQDLNVIDDGWDFVIINCEDPGYGDKIDECKRLGIPWGPYTWIYPGNGRRDMERAVNRTARHGDPPMGYWLDYEQGGVSPGDIWDALNRANELGVLHRTGFYTYLYMIGAVAGQYWGVPLWLAYYPGNNDGSFPEWAIDDAIAWNAELWQYTSGANAPVGLDKNLAIDDNWFAQWTGSWSIPDVPVVTSNNVKGKKMYLVIEMVFADNEIRSNGRAYLMSPNDRLLVDLGVSELDGWVGLPKNIQPYRNPGGNQCLEMAFMTVEAAHDLTGVNH